MADLPQTENLALELIGPWLTVWLNKPDSRNALSKEMLKEMKNVLESVREDRAIRGITFRGKGGVFCAGGDLKGFKEMATSEDKGKGLAREMSLEAADFFKMVNTCPQITVSVIEGAAIAGGFGLACSTDFVVIKADARLSLTETLIGLTPAQIAPYVIQKLGLPKARKLMLLADQIEGEEAKNLGLADFLAKNEQEILRILEDIRVKVLRAGPNALNATKKIISATQTLDQEHLVKFAADLFSDLLASEEGQEGFNSFLEKRKPHWVKE